MITNKNKNEQFNGFGIGICQYNTRRDTVTGCLGFSRLSIGMPPLTQFVLSAVIIIPPIL